MTARRTQPSGDTISEPCEQLSLSFSSDGPAPGQAHPWVKDGKGKKDICSGGEPGALNGPSRLVAALRWCGTLLLGPLDPQQTLREWGGTGLRTRATGGSGSSS